MSGRSQDAPGCLIDPAMGKVPLSCTDGVADVLLAGNGGQAGPGGDDLEFHRDTPIMVAVDMASSVCFAFWSPAVGDLACFMAEAISI